MSIIAVDKMGVGAFLSAIYCVSSFINLFTLLSGVGFFRNVMDQRFADTFLFTRVRILLCSDYAL